MNLPFIAASAIMLTIHAYGSYLGFRLRTFSRAIGPYIACYESAYYVFAVAQLWRVLGLLLPLIALMLIINVVGAYLYIRGYLGQYANGALLRYYAAFELFEFSIILALTISALP